jgi:hypothetical protein
MRDCLEGYQGRSPRARREQKPYLLGHAGAAFLQPEITAVHKPAPKYLDFRTGQDEYHKQYKKKHGVDLEKATQGMRTTRRLCLLRQISGCGGTLLSRMSRTRQGSSRRL